MTGLISIATEASQQFRNERLKTLYRHDFQAWKADILGLRTYQKMQEITDEALFGKINRTAIKSSNGTSKSFEIAAMIAWVGSVHDPGEALAIVTAPSKDQIEKVVWTYLKSFHARAAERGNPLPGWLNESAGWKIESPEGNLDLAFGRKPAAGSEVNVFQGTRSQFGRTYVFVEEAGGVSKALFTAAEAVLTGKNARGIYIGNPDDAGGEWQSIFEDRKYDADFNRFTISSFDLPTFTGEMVYPDDPQMQARMLESLTSVEWVEHKKRIWGEKDARYRSKVLGEFPEDGGTGFFSTADINTCYDTEIEEDLSIPCVFGVDIARMGTDECVIYVNRGGRVRLLDSWGKTDLYTSSKKIFEHAQRWQPAEIRIDGTGAGAGVWDNLAMDPQFAGDWDVIGIEGSTSSPDLTKWANKRSYNHDSAKLQMINGEIDLDVDDTELKEQLSLISFKFHNRGGVQVDKKEDMKTEMGGSPDRADAFIYAVCDLSPWTGNELNKLSPGEKIVHSPSDFLEQFREMGLPIGYGIPGDAF